jgi:hypothetical protein
VLSQTFGIRTFDNFAQAPKNAIVVVPESGTIRTFDIHEGVKLIPLFQIGTIRTLAAALGIPKSTLHNLKCDKDDPVIIPCTSALKPTLTEEHKLLPACYCVSKIGPKTRLYDDFYKNVDEKWFFITEKDLHLYIAPATKSGLVVILTKLVVDCLRFESQGCHLLHSP